MHTQLVVVISHVTYTHTLQTCCWFAAFFFFLFFFFFFFFFPSASCTNISSQKMHHLGNIHLNFGLSMLLSQTFFKA